MDNLDEFLTGNEPAVTDPAPAADPVADAPAADPAPADPAPAAERPRGPDGKFLPKGDDAAPPAAEEQHSIPPKALQEERRKRQELEARVAEYEARLAQQPQQPPADMFEDPDGWQQQFGQNLVQTAVNEASTRTRLEMSEMMIRQAHPDFEEKANKWLELVQSTPGLREKGLSNPHPWQFAYNYVENHERMEQLSATNVAELEAKLREQIKAELAAEKPAAPSQEIPETLADAQSARGGSGQALNIPTLDEILARK